MTITQQQLRYIINCDVEELVSLLQEDYQYTLVDAFDVVYNSKLCGKLTRRLMDGF